MAQALPRKQTLPANDRFGQACAGWKTRPQDWRRVLQVLNNSLLERDREIEKAVDSRKVLLIIESTLLSVGLGRTMLNLYM